MEGARFRPDTTFSPGNDSLDDSEVSCLTPRRRLSLDKTEKSPPSLTSSESGYSGSTCTDATSPGTCCGSLSSLDAVFLSSSGSGSKQPLRDITAVSNTRALRQCKQAARKASRLRCCSVSADNKDCQGTVKGNCFKVPNFLPFKDRPVSLPSFPPSPSDDGRDKQINSPMGNLAISSPPMDGFDLDMLMDGAEDSQHSPSSMEAFVQSPTTQFVAAVSDTNAVLRPTPVRPKAVLGCKQLQRQLSISSFESSSFSGVVRPSKRFVLSPHRGNSPKRSPLPFSESLPRGAITQSPQVTPAFVRSQSCVMHTLSFDQDAEEEKLIGDHSQAYCLPIEEGACPTDLKCISPQTVASVLIGDYDEQLNSCTIIDCRYPYEYNGGHVKGAINVWNKDDLVEKFLVNPKHPMNNSRDIIIFHCEFSSKRGPDMSRFLRKMDRQRNDMDFPKLYYPELYLTHGGYKSFYTQFHYLCEPDNYCKMDDERHQEDYRNFSKRSKSWSGETKKRCPSFSQRRRHTILGDTPKSTASRQL